MQDYHCPNCKGSLSQTKNQYGFVYLCKPCRGVAIGTGPLKKMVPEKIVTALWVKARQSDAHQSRPCPTCVKLMDEIVALEDTPHPVHVDICLSCYLVWFDQQEFEQFPKVEKNNEDLLLNNQKAREALAMLEIERIASQSRRNQPPDKTAHTSQAIDFINTFISLD
ncbi:MAG: hypothetical protein SGI98_12605 [Verrucomicrobiota bacterium]|nr:hypothetical protein [Verrucomicrobiota bacterium]